MVNQSPNLPMNDQLPSLPEDDLLNSPIVHLEWKHNDCEAMLNLVCKSSKGRSYKRKF